MAQLHYVISSKQEYSKVLISASVKNPGLFILRILKKNIYTIILLLVIVSILGCATIPVFRDRLSIADDIAGKAGIIAAGNR